MDYLRILIVEDSDYKFDKTEKFLKAAAENLEVGVTTERCRTLYEANQSIAAPTPHDGIVIDMQFPKRAGGQIERKCGIEFIHRLNYGMYKAPRVVNTSSDETIEFLNEAKIEVQCIVNDGRFDTTDEFEEFLQKVINHKEGK